MLKSVANIWCNLFHRMHVFRNQKVELGAISLTIKVINYWKDFHSTTPLIWAL